MAGSPTSTTEALAEVAELLGGDTQRSRRFLGGVIAGALVGAALAGSVLVRRRPVARRDAADRRSIDAAGRR